MNRTPDFDHGLLPSDHDFDRMKGNVLDRLDLTESAPNERRPARRRRMGALGLATAVVALAVAGTLFALPRGVSQSDARQAVFAELEGRAGAGDMVNPAKSLAEFLPNRLFSFNGGEPAPRGAGIVVGHVTAVSEGRAYVLVGDDADSDTEVPFDTKDPLYRTIDVTLEVSQGWGEFTDAATISFAAGVDPSGNARSGIDNYSQLGQIIVVLSKAGRYTYDPALYRVASSGTLIGTVSDDGTISFPAQGEFEQEFLKGTATLDDLDKAAAEDVQIFTLE